MTMMMETKGFDIRWAWRWESLGRSETYGSGLSRLKHLSINPAFFQEHILRCQETMPRTLIQLYNCSRTLLRWHSFPNANTALHRSFECLCYEFLSKALLLKVPPSLLFLLAIAPTFLPFQASRILRNKTKVE